jgi:hypothetical protein
MVTVFTREHGERRYPLAIDVVHHTHGDIEIVAAAEVVGEESNGEAVEVVLARYCGPSWSFYEIEN